MEKVNIADVGATPSISPATVATFLSNALGTEHLAINYFELAPGDQLGWDYHRHRDQEEVFVVLSGTLTFETDEGDVRVGADEAIRFAPDEFQLGHNREDERVTVLALGAPRGSRALQYRRQCEHCHEETIQDVELDRERRVFVVSCTVCEEPVTEIEPA